MSNRIDPTFSRTSWPSSFPPFFHFQHDDSTFMIICKTKRDKYKCQKCQHQKMNTSEICSKLIIWVFTGRILGNSSKKATFLTKFIILESLVTNLRGCERDALVSIGAETNLANEGRGELLPEERNETPDRRRKFSSWVLIASFPICSLVSTFAVYTENRTFRRKC
jgi:hypothetical protein